MQNNRFALYASLAMLLFMELAVFNKLRIFGVRPELLLIATVFFGFHFGAARGMEVGMISGILKDLFSMTAFGVNVFSFLLVGFLAGFLKDKLFKEDFITQFFLSCASVYFVSGIYFLYLDKIVGNNLSAVFWKQGGVKALYTGCMAPVLFFAFTKIFGSPKKQN
ncbi:MAG: rod shape-determining protein MreD [Candidatus Omnitrophica bacterium]|nr:rod shape-determining protein MreD [Candidatus Omnitrophota bacterium]